MNLLFQARVTRKETGSKSLEVEVLELTLWDRRL
jgi:hypothetical protein